MAGSNLEKIENAIAQADDASSSQPAGGASSRWNRIRGYGMTISGLPLLLPVGIYCEFFEKVAVTPLPNSPIYFSGLANIRGNVVPVYNLAQFLSPDDQVSAARHQALNIVQLCKGDDAAAIVCEKAPRTLDLTHAVGTKPALDIPQAFENCIARSLVIDGRQWHELDFLSLFHILAGR